jgi:outer membrane lipoprotein LolB
MNGRRREISTLHQSPFDRSTCSRLRVNGINQRFLKPMSRKNGHGSTRNDTEKMFVLPILFPCSSVDSVAIDPVSGLTKCHSVLLLFCIARRYAAVLLLAVVAGCATRPPLPEPAPPAVWEAHRQSLLSLQHWKVQGRVAIRDHDDGWNAEFDWQQAGDNFRIRLRGPFGQGGVELQGDPRGVVLRRQDQAPVYARNADELLFRETGWKLPVAGMHDWLRGLPVAQLPAQTGWDAQGRLYSLQQDGWSIDYGRYQRVAEYQLPERMQLERDAIRVKIVVDHWQLL